MPPEPNLPHRTQRLCHTQDQAGLDQCLKPCFKIIRHLLIRWSRVRISPDPPKIKPLNVFSGAFSFDRQINHFVILLHQNLVIY